MFFVVFAYKTFSSNVIPDTNSTQKFLHSSSEVLFFFRNFAAILDQLPRCQEREKPDQLDFHRRHDSIMTAAIHEINHNDKLTIDGCCNILVI